MSDRQGPRRAATSTGADQIESHDGAVMTIENVSQPVASRLQCLEHLIDMTRELKLMARSAGLSHVAYLLEMAEIEAQDTAATF